MKRVKQCFALLPALCLALALLPGRAFASAGPFADVPEDEWYSMEGRPSAPGAAFEDVPEGEWYADAVAWARECGIVSGYGDGTVYVSDTANGAVRRIKNGVVTTVAHRDESDLSVLIPTSPVGLAVCGDQLYVCDSFARKVFVVSLTR